MVLGLPAVINKPKGETMEFEDRPVYSCYGVCDYNINESIVQQPDIPEPSTLKQLWYGFGRLEALYQVNHTSIARAVNHGQYNEVVFSPKVISVFQNDTYACKFARDHVEQNLKRLGFQTLVNRCLDTGNYPDVCVRVPLNTKRNINLMRIFGPYMMFDKTKMLTSSALSQRKSKTK